MRSDTPPAGPIVTYAYGPQAARDLTHETLLTDGLGRFSLDTLAGVPTRRSAGLVAGQGGAEGPTSHLVSPLEELEVGGEQAALHALELAPGTFEGQGLDLLARVTLRDLLPEREQFWRGVRVRRRACMPRHGGALVLLYDIEARESVTLTLGGFFTDRALHAVPAQAPRLLFQASGMQVRVQGERETVVRVHLPRQDAPQPGQSVLRQSVVSALTPAPFAQRVHYRAEAEAGEPASESVCGCALWRVTLPPGGGQVALSVQAASAGALPVGDPWAAYQTEAARRRELALQAFGATGVADTVVATLAVAADAYLVQRPTPGTPSTDTPSTGAPGQTVVAGYPGLGDSDRDAMIALTGLTLVTGRAEVARDLLRGGLASAQRGLLPGPVRPEPALPEPVPHGPRTDAGAAERVSTADAALWLAVALERYLRTTGDGAFAREALPALRDLLDWSLRGTDHGVRADPDDGLLRCGGPGSRLTWMDRKVQDWVVTPRRGKPVEVQALWIAALAAESRLSGALGEPPAFAAALEQAQRGFAALWHPLDPAPAEPTTLAELLGLTTGGPGGLTGLVALGDPTLTAPTPDPRAIAGEAPEEGGALSDLLAHPTPPALAALADTLTPEGEPDRSVRPNAVLALALPDTPATDAQLGAVLAQTRAQLLTPLGLRTLSPHDPRYQGHVGGPRLVRDVAAHQGTVWAWPMGAYTELLLARGEVGAARDALGGLTGHLWEAGVGHMSQLFGGDSLRPGGNPFQASSVAEVLRAHVLVSLAERTGPPHSPTAAAPNPVAAAAQTGKGLRSPDTKPEV